MTSKPIVYVEWIDSCGPDRQRWEQFDAKIATCSECRTVGFLMEETRTSITLAFSHDCEDGNVSGWLAIPKVAIRKRVNLTEAA